MLLINQEKKLKNKGYVVIKPEDEEDIFEDADCIEDVEDIEEPSEDEK